MTTPRGNAYPFHRVAERVFNAPLMIHPGRAKIICNYLASRMGLPSLEIDADYDQPRRARAQSEPGSIAIIPIHGTLVHRSSFMAAMSGLTSYEDVTEAFREAMADADVSAILLDVDSGGGEVAGCFALADEIHAARGKKPIWAVANEHAFSAAYALASSADRIILPKTAGVGSVGVVCIHMDVSQADVMDGVSYTPIYAGARKIDGWSHAPLTDEAKADEQAEIDRLYGLFCATVGRNRAGRMDEAAARATEAGCFYGDEAVRLGLADQVGTIDEALSLLATEIDRTAGSSRGMSAAHSPKSMIKEKTMGTTPAADAPNAAEGFTPCADCSTPDECTAAGSCKQKDGTMHAAAMEAAATEHRAAMAAATDAHAAALAEAVAKAEAAAFAKGMEAGKAEGAKAARDEHAEIAAHCAASGMPELASDAIGKGLNIDAVRMITNRAGVAQAQATEVSSAHVSGAASDFTITREAAKDPAKYRQVRESAMAAGKQIIIVD